jgi:hypothetical protein
MTSLLLRVGTYNDQGRVPGESYATDLGRFSSSAREYAVSFDPAAFIGDERVVYPSDALENLEEVNLGQRILSMELEAAHYAARLPILTLIGATENLPRKTVQPGASPQPFVRTVLQVNWTGAFILLAAILAAILSAIAGVCYGCRDVFIPDYTSSLVEARLIQATLNQGVSWSIGSRKEIIEQMGLVRLRYGIRQTKYGKMEADLLDTGKERYSFPDGEYY